MCNCGFGCFIEECSQQTKATSGCTNCAGDDFHPQDIINPALSMNVAFSNRQIREEKKNLILSGIEQIKHLAYLNLDVDKTLINGKLIGTHEQLKEDQTDTCKKLLEKSKNSKLSLKEKTNLYRNIQAQITSHNTLYLYLGTNVIIQKYNIKNVPSEIIDNIVAQRIQIAINMILLNATYGNELNDYNYTEAFSFIYYFINLNLQLMRKILLEQCAGEIFEMYDYDGQLN